MRLTAADGCSPGVQWLDSGPYCCLMETQPVPLDGGVCGQGDRTAGTRGAAPGFPRPMGETGRGHNDGPGPNIWSGAIASRCYVVAWDRVPMPAHSAQMMNTSTASVITAQSGK